ncbi:MAG: DUF1700 domain-containing protein [Spirochaetales bacterium]|nr:DUF1700 domain-containing protein [Spirochaetales bacterium]
MTDSLNQILASLRAELADLPEEAIRRTIDFYEEYFTDALETGRSEEETLVRLGGVKEIAAHVLAEAALSGAELKPGPLSLTGALRRGLRGLAGSAAKASLVVGAAVPYSLALGCYFLAVTSFAVALAVVALTGFGLQGMPNADAMSRVSLAGVGLLCAAAAIAVGLGVWTAAGAIGRVTLKALRRGLRREREAGSPRESAPARRGKLWIAFLACGLAAGLGAVGAFLSDLPLRLFSIWNSMKPADLVVREWTYAPEKIREIEIRTMNSAIVVETGASGEKLIRLIREEPTWLSGTPVLENGRLAFREVSSGTLPFMDFIARHEGMTDVRITIPRGYRARSLSLGSGSGAVSVAANAAAVRVENGSGVIRFESGGATRRIRAFAKPGHIVVGGKIQVSGAYESGSGSLVELVSGDGTIDIR